MVDRPLLVDGEVIDGAITSVVFPTLLRTYWYPRLAWRIIEVTSSMSMAARWWRAVVLRPSLVKAWPNERSYDIYRP